MNFIVKSVVFVFQIHTIFCICQITLNYCYIIMLKKLIKACNILQIQLFYKWKASLPNNLREH